MNTIGRYRYVVLSEEKKMLKLKEVGEKAAQKKTRAIGLFVAGGNAVDKKVVAANKYVSEIRAKQMEALSKVGDGDFWNSVKNFFKSIFKIKSSL